MEKDPELQSAIQWWVDLETQSNDHSDDPALQAMVEDQEHKVKNLHHCLQDRQWTEVHCKFSWKQVVINIERQLAGGGCQ